jgi:hypothetical protein
MARSLSSPLGFLALAAALPLLAAGCATPPRAWMISPRRFHATSATDGTADRAPRPPPRSRPRPHAGSAAPVERALHARGLDFGTDGSVAALYGYLHDSQESVSPLDARPGDVIFFDLANDGSGCGSHVGLVETVDPDGRIAFRETRDGRSRRPPAQHLPPPPPPRGSPPAPLLRRRHALRHHPRALIQKIAPPGERGYAWRS